MSDIEVDYLPISAIQHYAFCPRQFALIYLEQQWNESYLTASGRVMHSRVHNKAIVQVRDSIISMRGLSLCSDRLGLYGVADVVEYYPCDKGVELTSFKGWYQPYPVEYKRGTSKANDCDRLQLCVQAMCLEEMHGVDVLEGALYYGSPRRREKVTFTPLLRNKAHNASKEMHTLLKHNLTPEPIYSTICKSCSMIGLCQPKSVMRVVHTYWDDALNTP